LLPLALPPDLPPVILAELLVRVLEVRNGFWMEVMDT
jgi:hypothetical protein